jgi:hypothetical protein
MSIGSIGISEIEFDIYSRHEIVPILMALQHFYVNQRSSVDEICTLIKDDIIEEQNEKLGCTGLSYWEILVLASVRLGSDLDYDQLQDLADNHQKLRQMLMLGQFDIKRYPRSTIHDNLTKLSAETIEKISQIVVGVGHRFYPNAVKQIRVDSFVVQKNIHYPTDANLLFDGIQKIIELTARLAKEHGIVGWRQYSYLIKKIKSTKRKIEKVARSKQKGKDKKLKKLYMALLEQISKIDERSLSTIATFFTIKEVANEPVSIYWMGVISELEYFIAGTEYMYDLAKRRVLQDEKIPHSEKIFSLFEPDTELINRGKMPYPIEFGHRVLVVEDSAGFIIYFQVMGIGITDEKVLVDVMKNLQIRFNDKIYSASFDKGFWTPNNLAELSEIVQVPCLPKKGKRSKADTEREGSKAFGKARKWHAGIESAIHALGSGNGLIVCRDKGIDGYNRYVALGVLGRNLHKLGTILMEKQRELKKHR